MQVHFAISKFMKRLERESARGGTAEHKTTMFLLLDYYYDFCSQKRDYFFSVSLSLSSVLIQSLLSLSCGTPIEISFEQR